MSLTRDQKAIAEKLFKRIETAAKRELRAFDRSDDAEDATAKERRDAAIEAVLGTEVITRTLGRMVRTAVREAA